MRGRPVLPSHTICETVESPATKESDCRHRRLLRVCRKWPRRRRAAERRDDLTASQSPLMLSVCRLERFARGKGTAFHSNR